MAEATSSKPASHMRSLGITQRATPLAAPWTGDFRVRFTDFQVNEINEAGHVLHLHTVGTGEAQQKDVEAKDVAEASRPQKDEVKSATANGSSTSTPAVAEAPIELSEEDHKVLSDLAGKEFTDDLLSLLRSSQNKDFDKPSPVTSAAVDDKFRRGQVHQEVRRLFQSKIETMTDEAGNITAKLARSRGGGWKRGRGARGGQQGDRPAGSYLHFTLYKENKDTMDVLNLLARFLRVKPQAIGYAGTKDRRASTVQRCSVRYAQPGALSGANTKLRGASTGDYEYQSEPIHLGQLLGNEFVITVKSCRSAGGHKDAPLREKLKNMKANVQSSLVHMAEHGWINYFGHQRFGTHKVGTHEMGKLILAGKYEDAVNSLLYYDTKLVERAESGEGPSEAHVRDELMRHRACMLFRTGKDVNEAQRIMPKRFTAEVSVIRHLTRSGQSSSKDFVGSIMFITRGLRSMYLHAYQSYVWNHVASRRWEAYGQRVIKGDLIIIQNNTNAAADDEQHGNGDIIHPEDEDVLVRARPLSEEEASSGRFTIHDVVLPTPGFEVIYPDNEIGAFYEEFMAREENGSLDPHKMRRMQREFSLPGRYRKLMNTFLAKPSAEIKTYEDDTEQMHPTDLDLITAKQIKGTKRSGGELSADLPVEKRTKIEAAAEAPEPTVDTTAQGSSVANSAVTSAEHGTVASIGHGSKTAVVLKFQLGKSAYATIVLRELMGDPPEDVSAGRIDTDMPDMPESA